MKNAPRANTPQIYRKGALSSTPLQQGGNERSFLAQTPQSHVDSTPHYVKKAMSVQKMNVLVSEDRLSANLTFYQTTVSDRAGADLPTEFLEQTLIYEPKQAFRGQPVLPDHG